MNLAILAKRMASGPGLYQLRAFGAKVTALVEGDTVVLVDAGWRGSVPLIARGLEMVGASIEQVRLIVLTHHHPDHTAGLAALVRATGASVAAHTGEAPLISGQARPPNPLRWRLLAWVTRPFLPILYGTPVPVDHLLDDGDPLPIRPDVRAIHIPGHTPGSIALYRESTGDLIVGDALQYRFRILTPPAAVISWDSRRAIESLGKLASLDFKTIWFSHFSPLKRNARYTLSRLVARTTS